jgi:hypothetical protein
MPAENEFERAVRQKMEDFRLPPADTDWQAVHDALHPPRRRRPLFWWWPLSLVMLAGLGYGIWIWRGPAAIAGETVALPLENPGTQHKTNGQTTDSSVIISKEQASTSAGNPIRQKTITNVLSSGTRDVPELPEAESKEAAEAPASPEFNTTGGDVLEEASAEMANPDVEVVENRLALPGTLSIEPTAQTIPTAEGPFPASASMLAKEMLAAEMVDKSAIRLPENDARWKKGLWLAVGGSHPAQSIGPGTKAATEMLSDYAGSNSGRSYTYGQSQYEKGIHLSAGFGLERTWNKRWKFMTGLGFGLSQWQQGGEIYKDSILLNGSLFSRDLVQSFQRAYSRWVFQVPAVLSGRIGGNSVGSFWWSMGLQNQFLISLQNKSNTSPAGSNLLANTETISQNSQARFYQPALMPGLMYEHAGRKCRWQLQPAISIALTDVYKSSANAQAVYPVEWQVQWRWWWK